MQFIKRTMALGVIPMAAAMLAAGCGDNGGSGDENRATAAGGETTSTQAASNSEVSFTSPADGETVDSNFDATVDVGDFNLDGDQVGMENEEGTGHVHFSLDGGQYDKLPFSATGALAEQLGVAGKYSPNVAPEISYAGIPDGEHTLQAYLVNNDHSNVEGAEASVTFTVKAEPGVKIPAEGSSVGKTFTVQVKLPEDFQIDGANVGKANQAGTGHLHYQLDGGKFDKLPFSETGALAKQLGIAGKYSPNVKPSLTYKNIPAGEHKLTVYLANNDHSHTDTEYTTTFTVA